jgi:exopolysaccharide biosynthesis polyprenyl glycosylphosphotransferase
MNPSMGVSKAHQENTTEIPAVDLRIVDSKKNPRTNGGFRRTITVCEVVADLLIIVSSIEFSYEAYRQLALGKHLHYGTHTVLAAALGFAVVMVLMLDRAGAYSRGNSLLRVRETEQVLRVSAQAFLVALAISFSSGFLFSRWLLVLCFTIVPLALFAEKTCMYLLVSALHARGLGNERVLIYGAGNTGRRVFSTLRRSPRLGFEPVLFVDDDPGKVGTTIFEMGYERRRCAPVVRGPVSKDLLDAYEVDSIIVAVPSIGREQFLRVVNEAFHVHATLSFVPSHFLASDSLLNYQDIDGVLLASFAQNSNRTLYDLLKRCIDVLFAIVCLTLGGPVSLLLAVLVRLDTPGRALFKQKRVGKDGKLFEMYKFRSMYHHVSGSDYSPKAPDDPRITRVGRFLRKTSLDELPQLLNVLEGSMSLVGPRPEMPFIVKQYGERERQRLQVKPGLTGLWQLSGDRSFLIHENIEYDLYYIQNRNVFMDIAILLHTLIFAMRGI